MKKIFDRQLFRLETAAKRITELKDIMIELSKIEKQRK
jgi:hypothetical protein